MNSGYKNKVLGGFLGKNIGGTLGGPYEGRLKVLTLTYYDPVPTEPLPNDDFELQLVWLDMLAKKGIFITPQDFSHWWLVHTRYCISEYFMGKRNMSRGILPPVSGAFNNWYRNGMGAAIRSEIWGLIAPGMPDIAAAYAYMDASTDHTDDGLFGEMFLAAMESAAFTESDPQKIIDIGLAFVPEKCAIRSAVEMVRKSVREGKSPLEIREKVISDFTHPSDWTYVAANLSFIMIGLLSGKGFGDSLCDAVNCGYDADCTGATLGSILGIIAGADGIPAEWLEPIGNKVVASHLIPGVDYAKDIDSLSDQVCTIGDEIKARQDEIRAHLLKWTGLNFLEGVKPFVLPSPVKATLASEDGVTVRLDYLDDPTIGYGAPKPLTLILENGSDSRICAELTLTAPEGWEISAECETAVLAPRTSACIGLTVLAHANIGLTNPIGLKIGLGGGKKIESSISLLGQSCWTIAPPISCGSGEIEKIEEKGSLDGLSGLARKQFKTDDLQEFIPECGQAAFVQTDLTADFEMNVRLVTNNSGPIKAFLNGDLIVDKTEKTPGINPTWHFNRPAPGKDAADVTLRPGRNTLMLRLDGKDYPQDVSFNVVKIDAPAIDKAEWTDYLVPTNVTNTLWHET